MNSDKVRLAVIGGGAASLAFVSTLKRSLENNRNKKLIIKVYDDSDNFGRGNAYIADLNSNLMNTKANYLTYDNGLPGDFYSWITSKHTHLKTKYQMEVLDGDTYVPRGMFGEYLAEKWKILVSELPDNLKIEVHSTKVEDVDQLGEKYIIYCRNGEVNFSDYLILATGTSNRLISTKYKNLGIQLIENPYPTKKLPQLVKGMKNIVVIGARLSAIDTVVAIKESGYDGNIIMHCINGTFPSVRGTQGRYENRYLSPHYIKDNFKDKITFSNISEMFALELKNYQEITGDFGNESIQDIFNRFPLTSLEETLEYEIEAAKNPRAWQAIFYDTNKVVSIIWQLLDDNDKEYFLQNLMNKLTGMRISIPLENAEKILSYIKNGSLTFSSGGFDLMNENNNGVVFRSTSGCYQPNIESTIFAIGSPATVEDSDFSLGKLLIEKGTLSPSYWGGVTVDINNNIVSADSTVNRTAYVIGDLSKGKHLFLAALDIIRKQADFCATNFLQESLQIQLSECTLSTADS